MYKLKKRALESQKESKQRSENKVGQNVETVFKVAHIKS